MRTGSLVTPYTHHMHYCRAYACAKARKRLYAFFWNTVQRDLTLAIDEQLIKGMRPEHPLTFPFFT